VPILILAKWIRDGKIEGEANYVRTYELKRRIESSMLRPPFKPKGDGGICGSLTSKQKARNLTRPIFIEPQGEGIFRVNLPYYEPLLQEYREKYLKEYSTDYKKLFPDKEPDWGALPSKDQTEYEESRPTLSALELMDEIHNLLAPIDQALRERQQAIAELTESNDKLQSELFALRAAFQERRESRRLVQRWTAIDETHNQKKEIVMIDSFSKRNNKIKTLILLVVCGLSAIASVVVGIDDNPPGVLLALFAAIAFILAFSHPWRTARKFIFLLFASILGFVLFIILNIILDTAAQDPATADALQDLMQSPIVDALRSSVKITSAL